MRTVSKIRTIGALALIALLATACGSAPGPASTSAGGTAPDTATKAPAAALQGLDLQATIDGVGGASAILATDKAVWVLDHSNAIVRRIDPATNKVDATVSLGGGFANGLGLAGGLIWTFHQTAGEALGIDPSTAMVVKTAKAGQDGDPFAVGDDAAWVITADTLVKIDGKTGKITTLPIDVTCEGGGLAAAGGFAWLASARGDLCKVDEATGAVVTRGTSLGNANGLAIVGGKPWLPNSDNGLAIVDPGTVALQTSIAPPAPGTFEGSMWSIGNAGGDNTILVGDSKGTGGWLRYTGGTVGRVTLGAAPAITLFAGFPGDVLAGGVSEAFGSVWIGNFGAGTVTRYAAPTP